VFILRLKEEFLLGIILFCFVLVKLIGELLLLLLVGLKILIQIRFFVG